MHKLCTTQGRLETERIKIHFWKVTASEDILSRSAHFSGVYGQGWIFMKPLKKAGIAESFKPSKAGRSKSRQQLSCQKNGTTMDFGISNGCWYTSVGLVWWVGVNGCWVWREGGDDKSDIAMHGGDDAKDYVVGWGWYEGWRWWIQESTCLARPTRATLGRCPIVE